MVKAQDKRPPRELKLKVQAALYERLEEVCKELDDSEPEYIVTEILREYLDGHQSKKPGRPAKAVAA